MKKALMKLSSVVLVLGLLVSFIWFLGKYAYHSIMLFPVPNLTSAFALGGFVTLLFIIVDILWNIVQASSSDE